MDSYFIKTDGSNMKLSIDYKFRLIITLKKPVSFLKFGISILGFDYILSYSVSIKTSIL